MKADGSERRAIIIMEKETTPLSEKVLINKNPKYPPIIEVEDIKQALKALPRYDLEEDFDYRTGENYSYIEESQKGEYVKWEDIKKYFGSLAE